MRLFQLIFISLLSFIAVINEGFIRQFISIVLCSIFSLSAATGNGYLMSDSRVNATSSLTGSVNSSEKVSSTSISVSNNSSEEIAQIRLPSGGSIENIVKGAVANQILKALGNFIAKEAPIVSSKQSVFPTVNQLPGGSFNSNKSLSSEKQNTKLTSAMLQGESAMGEQLAAAHKQQLPLVEDPKVVDYITRIGNDIANLMGRNDFKYEFNVVKDNSINAFALAGGKVFVNTGAILAANSEAEIAGLLAHEIGHAVLSHSFQQITNANLFTNLGQVIPFGKIISTLQTLNYSREHETQSDIIGTRALASAGYAADGLRNLFVTLKQQGGKYPPVYLSTHPAPESRVRYLEELIIHIAGK